MVRNCIVCVTQCNSTFELKAMDREPSGSFITSVLELKLDTNGMFEGTGKKDQGSPLQKSSGIPQPSCSSFRGTYF